MNVISLDLCAVYRLKWPNCTLKRMTIKCQNLCAFMLYELSISQWTHFQLAPLFRQKRHGATALIIKQFAMIMHICCNYWLVTWWWINTFRPWQDLAKCFSCRSGIVWFIVSNVITQFHHRHIWKKHMFPFGWSCFEQRPANQEEEVPLFVLALLPAKRTYAEAMAIQTRKELLSIEKHLTNSFQWWTNLRDVCILLHHSSQGAPRAPKLYCAQPRYAEIKNKWNTFKWPR